jgi:DNA recombination-dependent growth factor C
MPLLTGAVSARSYTVSEGVPDDYLADFEKALKRNCFRPIREGSGDLESFGWVNVRNLLDARMRPDSWHFSPYIILGLRHDRKTVPGAILKARVTEAVRRLMKQERRTKISRDERAELEMSIKAELLAQTLPSSNVTECAWNLETNRFYVASTSNTANDRVVAMFSDTFERAIIPQFPYLVAEDYAEKKNKIRVLEKTEATDFSAPIKTAELEVKLGVREVGA